MDTLTVIAWVITSVLFLVGLAGTVVPLLPGPTIIFVAAIIHFFLAGAEHSPGWPGYTLLTILLILSFVLEWLASALGTKKFGGSKAGIWGALIGGIVGIFFGLPGLFLGPIFGALTAEIVIAKRKIKESGLAATGAFVGLIAGMVAKFGCSIAMIGIFLFSALNR
jgi:uncharacterized protein YqgC (DUF456 family)